MSDDEKPVDPGNESEIDPGEPVKELAGFEYQASDRFLALVHTKIERRSTVSQFASFGWNVPKVILAEFWHALIQIVGSQGEKKKG